MPRMAAKLLVVVLALSVSPLHASGPVTRAPAGPKPALAEALAALPEPMSEAEFYELVNAASAPGYAVGSAQGAQTMVITINVSMPGNAPAASAPPPGIPPGTFNVDSFFDVFSDIEVGGPTGGNPTTNAGFPSNWDTRFAQGWLSGGNTQFADWSQTFDRGTSSDVISGGDAPDEILGGGGRDTIRGDGSSDVIRGGESRDTNRGDSGRNDYFDAILDSNPPTIASDLLRSPADFDTEMWLYAADGSILPNPDPSGAGIFDAATPLDHCSSGASLGCDSFFDIFSSSTDLLSQCSGGESPLCTALLDTTALGEPGTYFVIVDGFGDAADDGFYTLKIDDTAVSSCTPEFTSTECDLVADLINQLAGLNDACTAETTPFCDAIGMPSSVLDEFEPNDNVTGANDLGTLGEGRTVIEGDTLRGDVDSDWFGFTLDHAAAIKVFTAPGVITDPVDTEIWLYDGADFAGCASDPTTPPCLAAGQVFNNAFELAQICSDDDDSPACDLFSLIGPEFLEPGTYFVRVEYAHLFGADAVDTGDYTLNIEVDPGVCLPDPGLPGCNELLDIVGGILDHGTVCDVYQEDPGCLDLAPDLPGGLAPILDASIDGGDLEQESDWYSFTLSPPALKVAWSSKGPPPGCADNGCGFAFGPEITGLCNEDPTDANCQAAGQVFSATADVLSECAGNDAGICPGLLGAGQYYLAVSAFPGAWDTIAGDYSLNITIDPAVVDPCNADPSTPGCGSAALLHNAFGDYTTGCETAPSPGCTLTTLQPGGPAATIAGGRTITVVPGTSPGHFELTETGDGTATFRVTEEVEYAFTPTSHEQISSIFTQLPAGAILVTDEHRIKLAPDGKTHLYRDNDGNVFTNDTRLGAPGDTLIPLSADNSDPNVTVFTGDGGVGVVVPSPFVTYVNVNDNPGGLAVTDDEIEAAIANGGAAVVITADGGSTGQIFDTRFLNFGKPGLYEGDAIVEVLTPEEADGVRAVLLDALSAANNVSNVPATGYCAEKDMAVPGNGTLFRFASAGKSAEFDYARIILVAARQVEAAGLLNPDSDPVDYTHSIRQWAIWTFEQKYDFDGFGNAFVGEIRKAIEAERDDIQWNETFDSAVRDLVPNRWNDINQVLDRTDLEIANDDDVADDAPASGATLGLLLAGLIAALISRPGARSR